MIRVQATPSLGLLPWRYTVMAKTEITLRRFATELIDQHGITLNDFVGSPDRSDVFENLCSWKLSRALVRTIVERKPSTLGILAEDAKFSIHQDYWFRRVQIPERVARSPLGLVRHAVLVALLSEVQQVLIERSSERITELRSHSQLQL